MTTATVMFLALRALHVLTAAIWIGSAVFLAMVVLPSIDAAGPAGGQVMGRLGPRNNTYMAILAGTTVLTGPDGVAH